MMVIRFLAFLYLASRAVVIFPPLVALGVVALLGVAFMRTT